MEETENKELHLGCLVFVVIIVSILIILAILFFTVWLPKLISNENGVGVNTDGVGKLLSRSANNGDIKFEVDDDFSFSINMIVTPNTDIKDLQLTLQFLDKNQKVLMTKNHVLGNVSKNVGYKITYKLSDFSLSQMFKIVSVRASVTGGTVSYFA